MWEPPQCGEWTIESFGQHALQVWNLEFGICLGFGIWNLEFPPALGRRLSVVSGQRSAFLSSLPGRKLFQLQVPTYGLGGKQKEQQGLLDVKPILRLLKDQ